MNADTPNAFSFVFLAALAASLAVRLWLATRQVAHVRTHRDAVPAAFAARIGISAHHKAADYTVTKQHLGMLHAVVDAVVLCAMTLGGGLAAIVAWTGTLPGGPLVQDLAMFAAAAIVFGAASLPFTWWHVFRIEERFGFNRMTTRLWVTDLVKGIGVVLVLGTPLLALVLWLMSAAGGAWWLWAWAAWMGFQLLVLVLYPTWIAPLFNKFTPLPAGAARERIEALLARCGFASRGLYVMDGSRRSSHGNAFFTGFGRARRIVFFDTLLARLAPEEIEAVLAHELGHFKRRHVVKRMLWMGALSLAFLALLAHLMASPWFYEGLGVPAATERPGVALILFFLVLPVFTFVLGPLSSVYSRKHEFEADEFAVQNASGAALSQALVKLYEDNAATLTPDPIHSAFYDSHPPAAVRIARLAAVDAPVGEAAAAA